MLPIYECPHCSSVMEINVDQSYLVLCACEGALKQQREEAERQSRRKRVKRDRGPISR